MVLTEKKLRESEERFKALFKGSPIPTYAWQKVGVYFKLIDYNNAADIITHGNVRGFLGLNSSEMYRERLDILEDINRCFDNKTTIVREMKYYFSSLKVEKYLLVKYAFLPPDLVLVHTEDITERKKTEEKLKESEEKCRILFNNTPFVIVLFGIDGTILDCNDTTEKITGYNKEELIGNNFRNFNFYVDIKSANIEERQIQTSSGKISKPREILLYRKDGSQFWSSSHIEFIHIGESTYIQAFIHDITEKKQSEIKLNESEHQLQERVKELNCLFEISKVAENQNLSINEIINEMVNLIPYAWQFPNLTTTRIIYDGNEFESVNFKESKWTISTQVDINEKLMDIEIFYQKYKTFLREEEHLLAEIGNRLKTIIEKKNSEVDLNIEKHFTEDILNASTDTIFVFNPETGEAIRWNRGFNEMTGYSDEEISIMKAPDSYYSDQDLNRASEAIERILTDGIATVELSLITKEGRKIPYEYRATAFKNNEGKLLIVSIGRDITERKEAEQKLKESEEKFRSIAEQSFMGIIVIQDGLFKYFNKRTTEVNGYPADEIKSWKPNEFAKIIHPDDREFVMEQARNKQTGNPDIINQYSFRIIKKDGEIRWLDLFSKTINYEGRPADLTMTVDITDRINAERKLKESEERYRLIAENSDTVVWTTDMNLNLIYVSSNSPKLLGYTDDEAISAPLSERLTPDSLKKVAKIFREELKSERKKEKDLNRARTYLSEQIHKDGSIIPVEITFTFVRDGEGKAVGILGTSRNISERIETEQKLRESQRKYQTLAMVSPVGIFNTERDGNCLYVNDRWIELAGISYDDAMGEGWNKAIHPDDRERVFNNWYTTAKNLKIFKSEYRFMRPDGTVTWVIGQALPIRDESGEVQGYVGTITDINELKEAEAKLKNSEENYRDAYDRANFYKDLFTHDMNNILQIINSSAEIIGFQLGDSETSMYIENMTKLIKSQVERGSKLISNVRTLTELDEEEEISTKQVNISKFLNSAINFVKKAYSDRNISIFAVKLDQKYYTNANELLQDVFDNILINSVKYNENLGVEIYIKISKQIMDGKNYFKLELSDNGIGVPDDRKDVIFQPGKRELKGTKGMGIGLSLVKKILDIFEGKIWVEDKIKGDYTQGSNFIVLLPEVN